MWTQRTYVVFAFRLNDRTCYFSWNAPHGYFACFYSCASPLNNQTKLSIAPWGGNVAAICCVSEETSLALSQRKTNTTEVICLRTDCRNIHRKLVMIFIALRHVFTQSLIHSNSNWLGLLQPKNIKAKPTRSNIWAGRAFLSRAVHFKKVTW